MEIKIENMIISSKCKCCLEEEDLKNMWGEHYWMGEREIYGEMLTECFLLDWHQPDGDISELICDPCITRLRDAFNFKKQVLASQQMIHDITLENDTCQVLKVEKYELNESQSDCDVTEYEQIEYLEDEYQPEIKEDQENPEESQEIHQNKWLKKRKRMSAYKQYTEEDLRKSIEAVRSKKMNATEASKKFNIPRKTISAKLAAAGIPSNEMKLERMSSDHSEDMQEDSRATQSPEPGLDVRNFKRKGRVTLEIEKLRENVRTVLLYTNATAIHGHWGIGYACRFCSQQYPNPANLKKHSLKCHGQKDIAKIKVTFDHNVKLDITDLICTLCGESIDVLENMMDHLKVVHRKPMHTDIKNQIIPFKFEGEGLKCALCSKEFTFFKLLAEHMKEHYRNYECHICHRGFINKQTMKAHLPRHKKGVFKCSFCPKVFDTRPKRQGHERVVHICANKTHKCGYCSEKFQDGVQRNNHEVEKHGIDPLVFKCQACDKIFGSQRSLTAHTNRFHLMLKPVKCTECDMSFHNKNGLKLHMVKHTGIRKYECAICNKSYGRKTTLTEHMRIHADDRRFKCEHCEQSFVQKCTWRGHLRARHGEFI